MACSIPFGARAAGGCTRAFATAARERRLRPDACLHRAGGISYPRLPRGNMSKPSDLLQGTLDMLLLKMLALEPLNGFAVSQRLKQVSGDVLQVSDGSLYPALHKLELEGRIRSEWKTSVNGRRAKFYSLTRLGRRQLEKETDNWGRLSHAISQVVKLTTV
jgi:PadR family transcriptional regulator PadR